MAAIGQTVERRTELSIGDAVALVCGVIAVSFSFLALVFNTLGQDMTGACFRFPLQAGRTTESLTAGKGAGPLHSCAVLEFPLAYGC